MIDEKKSNLTNLDLFLDQKQMLDVFLSNGTLSKKEYDTTLKSLMDQMRITGEMIESSTRNDVSIHGMRLSPLAFHEIKNGKKVVEARLNDEKRRLIKVGDVIVFTDISTQETVKVIVTALYNFSSFTELYDAIPGSELGYAEGQIKDPLDMRIFYSEAEEKQYGVLGIRIKLL